MADENGARISNREIFDMVVTVRDEVSLLKQAAWFKAEADKTRDAEIERLRNRYYVVLGTIGGMVAGLIALVVK